MGPAEIKLFQKLDLKRTFSCNLNIEQLLIVWKVWKLDDAFYVIPRINKMIEFIDYFKFEAKIAWKMTDDLRKKLAPIFVILVDHLLL